MHKGTKKTLTGQGSIGDEQFFKTNESCNATLKIKSCKMTKGSINKFTGIGKL